MDKNDNFQLDIPSESTAFHFYNTYLSWCRSKAIKKQSISCRLKKGGYPARPFYQWYETDKINNHRNTLIFVDAVKEGCHQFNDMQLLEPSNHYVFFTGADWNTDTAPLDCEHTVLHYSFFLYSLAESLFDSTQTFFHLPKTYSWEYPKPCLFTMMNSIKRMHRDDMKRWMLHQIKMKYIYRYGGVDYGIESDHLDYLTLDKNKDHNQDIVTNQFRELFKDENDPHWALWKQINGPIYDQGYFALITETDFYLNDVFFLTEKTVKALYLGIPFVIVGTSGFLKRLHNLGFRTYGELWDESYDDIENYDRRMYKLVHTITNLQHFDWQANKEKLKEIGDHNRLQFFQIDSIADKEFAKIHSQLGELLDRYG